MKGSRRINVFYRSDGKCVHDKTWDEDGVSHSGELAGWISAAVLWSMIQVFIQFAREVQGGSVKRLVFRNPEAYAPAVKHFQPAPRQKRSSKNPVEVYIAHDELFAVTVTEIVRKEDSTLGLEAEESTQAPALTIAEFCEAVLDFLNKEHASFLSTLRREDSGVRPLRASINVRQRTVERQHGEDVANFRPVLDTTSSGSSSGSSAGSSTAGSGSGQSRSLDESGTSPVNTLHPVVTLNESRLSEFMSKTLKLLRM